MIDKLIVQLQDTARVLRNSADETVKSELRNALRCINDADKLKQVQSAWDREHRSILLNVSCSLILFVFSVVSEISHEYTFKEYGGKAFISCV